MPPSEPLPDKYFEFPQPLDTADDKSVISVIAVQENQTDDIFRRFPDEEQRLREAGFEGKAGQTYIVYANTSPLFLLTGVATPIGIYDFAHAAEAATRTIKGSSLDQYAFKLETGNLEKDDLIHACAGWYLGCYKFDFFKTGNERRLPQLLWPEGIDRTRVAALLESLFVTRNLINIPANLFGPAELEHAVRIIAGRYDAQVTVTADDTLEHTFPLVYAVGNSSPRRPRVIDMIWGDPAHPKVTLVGKGVCFDTGGLDIKPHDAMLLMKKDMGGAAHALGTAIMVMKTGLPVRLRVIIPAVENSISGHAFRLGDVFASRKGITVENGNTDAEGRLIIADCLTLATEETPDLVVDFTTLTGSARAGLGFDIPAFFTNNDSIIDELKNLAFAMQDPLWPLPLWKPYRKDLNGDVADLSNVGKGRGDAIHAALFLKEFLHGEPDWIHLDMYAWEQNGRPGRPKGGAETGLLSIFRFLENRYSQ